jgi:hypothetical protein
MPASTFIFLIFEGDFCAFCHFLFSDLPAAIFAIVSNKKKAAPFPKQPFCILF